MSLKNFISEFSGYLLLQHYSERTIVTYTANVEYFCDFLQKYYPRIQAFEQVTKDIVFDYQNYLSKNKNRKDEIVSTTTQRLKLTALKKLFSFLLKKDYILFDPTTAIDMPREEEQFTRNILSEEEVTKLLKNIPSHTPVGMRNRAMIELFYGCGIRTSELCNLKIRDVNLKDQTATIIKGKGNKSRIVPIGVYASYYIEQYLEKARKYMLRGKLHDPGNLFLSVRGNPFNKCTINKSVIQEVTKGFQFDKHISCYTFRHSVATHLLARHLDIAYIAKLLGHASLRTTQRYVHIEIGDLKKMHSMYHPREISSVTERKNGEENA